MTLRTMLSTMSVDQAILSPENEFVPKTLIAAREASIASATTDSATPTRTRVTERIEFAYEPVIRIPRRKCSGYPTCVMNETIPDEAMYSPEKDPMIANEREVTSDSRDEKNCPELTFVLSMNNHPRICGNHISGFYGRLKIVFFGLEFNIPEVDSGHSRRFPLH